MLNFMTGFTKFKNRNAGRKGSSHDWVSLIKLFAMVFLTSVAALGGWFISEESYRRNVPIVEYERQYIYGFGKLRSSRPFGDYLEEVTVEGLREIRWDHMHYGDPRFAGTAPSTGYFSSNSSNFAYATTTTTGMAITCTQPATLWN
jgi:hypothetical protein